jgi:nickel-dependent lactate racemase
MGCFQLRQNAWFADELTTFDLPDNWEINVLGDLNLPALTRSELAGKIRLPLAARSIADLAADRKSAALIIDDFSRPTPTGDLLPVVLEELNSGGISSSNVVVVVACGTHPAPDQRELLYKLGQDLPADVRVVSHDARNHCDFLGYTSRKTPVYINHEVLNRDLKISIGSVYPHPAAGFSGGGKLIALGTAGEETIRIMHDYRAGYSKRSGNIDITFRKEINEISMMAGLDFSINVLLNQDRKVTNLFCGNSVTAFEKAVNLANQNYRVELPPEADLVISDMYPFDTDFQFAFDRGMWPLEKYPKNTIKVVLAYSTKGIGGHKLFPVANPIRARVSRRIKNFTLRDLLKLPARAIKMIQMVIKRDDTVYVVSSGIKQADLARVMPKAVVFTEFSELVNHLTDRELLSVNRNEKVVCVRTAPMLAER